MSSDLLTHDQRKWLESCPPGETRSITIDGCEYKVSRAWGLGGLIPQVPTMPFEPMSTVPMVTVPEIPTDNARVPEPWELTQGSARHVCVVDDCCPRR